MADLRNIIRQLAQPDGETVALVCVVDDVDEQARTIDCTPLNEGAPLLGVNLQANQGTDYGVCLIPERGSYVVVGFVSDGAAGVVLLTEKIKSAEIVIGDNSATLTADGLSVTANQTTFNGGNLGGLVKIQELTDRLNIIENDINGLKEIFSTWVPVSQDGGAALKTAAVDWIANPLTLTTRDNYENTKIKQ